MVKHHIFSLVIIIIVIIIVFNYLLFFYIKTNLKEMGGERDDVDDGNDTNIRDLYYFNTAKSLLTG